MFRILIQATSLPASDAVLRQAGAYVVCWININVKEDAEAFARKFIEEEGWIPHSVDDCAVYRNATDVEECERQYYEEALEDGASFVFHQYTADEE